jgi:hypothetical protein
MFFRKKYEAFKEAYMIEIRANGTFEIGHLVRVNRSGTKFDLLPYVDYQDNFHGCTPRAVVIHEGVPKRIEVRDSPMTLTSRSRETIDNYVTECNKDHEISLKRRYIELAKHSNDGGTGFKNREKR